MSDRDPRMSYKVDKSLVSLHRHDQMAGVICLQETKLLPSALRSEVCIAQHYFSYFSVCGSGSGSGGMEKAYSGTATFVRKDLPVYQAQQGLTGRVSRKSSRGRSGNSGNDTDIIWVESEEVGLSEEELRLLDAEGRCVITDHGSFVLFNVYAPNAHTANMVSTTKVSNEEDDEDVLDETNERWEVTLDTDVNDLSDRYVFKMKFNYLLSYCVRKLQLEGRKVVVVGDLNVNSQRIDHCEAENHDYTEPFGRSSIPENESPAQLAANGAAASVRTKNVDDDKQNYWKFSFESRPQVLWMKNILSEKPYYIVSNIEEEGNKVYHSNPLLSLFSKYLHITCDLVDTFRHHWPTRTTAYTCWNSLTGARKTNFGTRLDYILVSSSIVSQVLSADIDPTVEGSDHCPVHCYIRANLFQSEHSTPHPPPPPSLCTIYTHSTVQTSMSSFVLTTSTRSSVGSPLVGGAKAATTVHKSATVSNTAKRNRPSSSSVANPMSVAIMESLFRINKPVKNTQNDTDVLLKNVSPNRSQLYQGLSEDCTHISSTCTALPHLKRQKVTCTKSLSTVTSPSAVKSLSMSSFRALLAPVKVPRCSGHNEACATRTVNKVGPNEGRRYIIIFSLLVYHRNRLYFWHSSNYC